MREENMNIESVLRNQNTSSNENAEYSTFVGWVKKHKKGILIAGGAIVAIGRLFGL
jgi:inosine/xanthosine triphosphate pyrophosphatase family protein